MTYSVSNPPFIIAQGVGHGRAWRYISNDTAATVGGDGYFSNGYALGLRAGDTITVVDASNNYETTTHAVISSSASGVNLGDPTGDGNTGGGGGGGGGGGEEVTYAQLTVTTLKQLTSLTLPEVPTGQRVSVAVLGQYATGDSGSRFVYWDATANKSTHNGGTIIAPEALDDWDGTGADIETLLDWTGSGSGCWVSFDQSYFIEFFGASTTISINDVVINHICQLSTSRPLKTKSSGHYSVYPFSNPINFNNRSFDLKNITLRPINSFPHPSGTILVRTGTSQVSIRDSYHHTIKIDGNAGSISGGISNAANQANAFIAFMVYGDRTPKSSYYIDLTNCTYGVVADADCECTEFEVHASYVDYLIDEREADESHWRIFSKYSKQWFQSDGQSSGYAFFMVEQSIDGGSSFPCVYIKGGKSYSIGGMIRAINGQPIVIDDAADGVSGTGHINFDDLQIVQVRDNIGMRLKNIDVVTGSLYMENYTAGGIEIDDVRCAADLTLNMSDCRGGLPVAIKDLGASLGLNSTININVSYSTTGTPSANAIEITACQEATINVGKCHGNITVGSAVSGVHMNLDADFIRNSKTITVGNTLGQFSAKIGGYIPLSYLESRVEPWAFNGLQLENVYRDASWSSPMVWSNTGFVPVNKLVSTVTQLSVQKDMYKINDLFKVVGSGVYLIDTKSVVYPDSGSATANWLDAAGGNVITSISTTDLKYTNTFTWSSTATASYSLADDNYTVSRPDSANLGRVVYTLPNGTYRIAIQHISGGALNIRDTNTIRFQVNTSTDTTYDVVISTGVMRIENQSHPATTVFKVRSLVLL